MTTTRINTVGTDVLIEQMTQAQPERNQHQFREALRSLVRMAHAEGKLEAVQTAREALMAAIPERVH